MRPNLISNLLALFTTCASPAISDVILAIGDGNPWDRLKIHNLTCAPLWGELNVDMVPSIGKVHLDTEYGGPGTKDPMPVEIEHGPLILHPVTDGDQHLTVNIGGLNPNGWATVRFDLDNTSSWLAAPRVEVHGEHIQGAIASLKLKGRTTSAVFNENGQARLNIDVDCTQPNKEPEPLTVPIS